MVTQASALHFKLIIELGNESYYSKFGFEPTTRWNIKPSFKAPTNVFMKIALAIAGLTDICGTVEYPKEFEAL
jgi:predicted N-acetyltransferase YhbS